MAQRNRIRSKFICKICSNEFSNKYSYVQHCVNVHEMYNNAFLIDPKSGQYNTFICSYCGEIYTSRMKFKSHYATHSNTGFYTCELCQMGFMTEEILREHVSDIHSEHNCKHCKETFPHKTEYVQHECSVKKTFRCRGCNKIYSSRVWLRSHVAMDHPLDDRYNCQEWDKLFSRHLRWYRDTITEIQCDYCLKNVPTWWKLKVHLTLVHPGKIQYHCKFCDRKFKQVKNLSRHLSNVHRISEEVYDSDVDIENKETQEQVLEWNKKEIEDTEIENALESTIMIDYNIKLEPEEVDQNSYNPEDESGEPKAVLLKTFEKAVHCKVLSVVINEDTIKKGLNQDTGNNSIKYKARTSTADYNNISIAEKAFIEFTDCDVTVNSGHKIFRCGYCSDSQSQIFTDWYMLNLHYNKHPDLFPYTCKLFCERQFKSMHEVCNHIEEYHNVYIMSLLESNFKFLLQINDIITMKNDTLLKKLQLMDLGLLHLLPILYMQPFKNQRVLMCKLCQEYHTSIDAAKHHMIVEHYLDKESSAKWEGVFLQYALYKTDEVDKILCQFCEGKFVKWWDLNVHFIQYHPDKLPYTCKECKSLLTFSQLWLHLNSPFTTAKPHSKPTGCPYKNAENMNSDPYQSDDNISESDIGNEIEIEIEDFPIKSIAGKTVPVGSKILRCVETKRKEQEDIESKMNPVEEEEVWETWDDVVGGKRSHLAKDVWNTWDDLVWESELPPSEDSLQDPATVQKIPVIPAREENICVVSRNERTIPKNNTVPAKKCKIVPDKETEIPVIFGSKQQIPVRKEDKSDMLLSQENLVNIPKGSTKEKNEGTSLLKSLLTDKSLKLTNIVHYNKNNSNALKVTKAAEKEVSDPNCREINIFVKEKIVKIKDGKECTNEVLQLVLYHSCCICGELFPSKLDYESHPCRTDSKDINNKEVPELSTNFHIKECRVVLERCTEIEKLQEKYSRKRGNNLSDCITWRGQYRCKICSFVFSSMQEYEIHDCLQAKNCLEVSNSKSVKIRKKSYRTRPVISID